MSGLVLHLVALLVAALSQFGAPPAEPGEYSARLSITGVDYQSNIATADVVIEARVLPGDGLAYIPLPFVPGTSGRFLVEPNRSDTLVLFGHLAPAENCSLIQISRSDAENRLVATLTDVQLPLGDSRSIEPTKVLFVLFQEAQQDITLRVDEMPALHLTQVILRSPDIDSCQPAGYASALDEYTIEFPEIYSAAPSIYCHLSPRLNWFVRLGVPLLVAIPVGLVSGIQLVKSVTWAKRVRGVSIIALVGIAAAGSYFVSATPNFLSIDLLLASGALIGMLLGLLASAINIIRQHEAGTSADRLAQDPFYSSIPSSPHGTAHVDASDSILGLPPDTLSAPPVELPIAETPTTATAPPLNASAEESSDVTTAPLLSNPDESSS